MKETISSATPPRTNYLDDVVFKRVEADVARRHEAELGGPPNETDPGDLARHLRWWSKMCPPGEIDYDDPENVARHAISFHANKRLFQRVDALPVHIRQRVVEAAFAAHID